MLALSYFSFYIIDRFKRAFNNFGKTYFNWRTTYGYFYRGLGILQIFEKFELKIKEVVGQSNGNARKNDSSHSSDETHLACLHHGRHTHIASCLLMQMECL